MLLLVMLVLLLVWQIVEVMHETIIPSLILLP